MNSRTGQVRELELADHPGRHAARVGDRRLADVEHLLRAEVVDGPQDHGGRGVALDQGQRGVGGVVGIRVVQVQGVGAEGGVLEGVGVLVGVADLRLGRQLGVGHDDHRPGDWVVVAQHPAGQQLELELGVVLVRRQQAQGVVQGVVRRLLLGRVVLVPPLGEAPLHLGAGQELRWTDVGRRHVPDVRHLVLDGGQRLVEGRRTRHARAGGGARLRDGRRARSGTQRDGNAEGAQGQDRHHGQGQDQGHHGHDPSGAWAHRLVRLGHRSGIVGQRFRFLHKCGGCSFTKRTYCHRASQRSFGISPPPSLLRAPVSLGGHRRSCFSGAVLR